jgi:hypothetical protein
MKGMRETLVVTGMVSVGRIERLVRDLESTPASKVTKTLVISMILRMVEQAKRGESYE